MFHHPAPAPGKRTPKIQVPDHELLPVLTSYLGSAQNMTVPDVHSGERLSSYAALARWMEGQVVHAADGLDVENPTCP